MKRWRPRTECCCWSLVLLSLTQAVPVNRIPTYNDKLISDSINTAYVDFNKVCLYNNEYYTEGQNFTTSNPCETCVCHPPGFACSLKSCEMKPGCRAIHTANQCCPEYVCECERNGQTYANGEKVEEANPCKVCYCKGGEIKCALVTCYTRDDCEPIFVPGRCCPKYDHCPPLETMKNKATTVKTSLVVISDLTSESESNKFFSESTTTSVPGDISQTENQELLESTMTSSSAISDSIETTDNSPTQNESTTVKVTFPSVATLEIIEIHPSLGVITSTPKYFRVQTKSDKEITVETSSLETEINTTTSSTLLDSLVTEMEETQSTRFEDYTETTTEVTVPFTERNLESSTSADVSQNTIYPIRFRENEELNDTNIPEVTTDWNNASNIDLTTLSMTENTSDDDAPTVSTNIDDETTTLTPIYTSTDSSTGDKDEADLDRIQKYETTNIVTETYPSTTYNEQKEEATTLEITTEVESVSDETMMSSEIASESKETSSTIESITSVTEDIMNKLIEASVSSTTTLEPTETTTDANLMDENVTISNETPGETSRFAEEFATTGGTSYMAMKNVESTTAIENAVTNCVECDDTPNDIYINGENNHREQTTPRIGSESSNSITPEKMITSTEEITTKIYDVLQSERNMELETMEDTTVSSATFENEKENITVNTATAEDVAEEKLGSLLSSKNPLDEEANTTETTMSQDTSQPTEKMIFSTMMEFLDTAETSYKLISSDSHTMRKDTDLPEFTTKSLNDETTIVNDTESNEDTDKTLSTETETEVASTIASFDSEELTKNDEMDLVDRIILPIFSTVPASYEIIETDITDGNVGVTDVVGETVRNERETVVSTTEDSNVETTSNRDENIEQSSTMYYKIVDNRADKSFLKNIKFDQPQVSQSFEDKSSTIFPEEEQNTSIIVDDTTKQSSTNMYTENDGYSENNITEGNSTESDSFEAESSVQYVTHTTPHMTIASLSSLAKLSNIDESIAPVLAMISDQLQFLKVGEEQPLYVEPPTTADEDDIKTSIDNKDVIIKIPTSTPMTVEMVKVIDGKVEEEKKAEDEMETTTNDESERTTETFVTTNGTVGKNKTQEVGDNLNEESITDDSVGVKVMNSETNTEGGTTDTETPTEESTITSFYIPETETTQPTPENIPER